MVDKIGSQFKDYAPFVLRLALGVVFIIQGVRDLTRLGSSPPVWTLVSVGVSVVGGLLVLIGLLTRWAAAALLIVTVVAIADWPGFRVIHDRNHQLLFAALMMSLAVFFSGGGDWSVDMKNKRKEGT